MATIVLRDAWKQYPDGAEAVRGVSLSVEDGEFLALVGPSGCGKSTTLRMIAGLEDFTSGSLHIGERDVTALPPKQRDVAMVFQSYALYPHMTVAENMGFALRLAKLDKSEIDRRVREAASTLDLVEHLDRKPGVLSGGQQQRVAMGRAIVRQPQAWLMDEPLSNLDAKLRVAMRAEIAALQHRLGVTTIYVTHDQVEAMTMADRVAVLHRGVLQQVAPPQQLYDRPDNLFVAGFIGSPAMNLAEAVVRRVGDGLAVEVGGVSLALPDRVVGEYPRVVDFVDRQIAIGMRPEHFVRAGDGGTPWGEAEVELVELLGSEMLVHVTTAAKPVVGIADAGAANEQAAGGHRMVAKLQPGVAPRVGERIALGFKAEHLHLFALETGAALR